MQTLHLEIQSDLKDALLAFLRLLPSSSVRIYEDDDAIFTDEDKIAFDKAIKEKHEGQSIGLEELKRKYQNVSS